MIDHKSEESNIESIFLKCNDIVGYASQIIRTSASEIDHWLIIVKKVSPIIKSISDVYKFGEFGI